LRRRFGFFRGIPSGAGEWFTEKRRSGAGALIDIEVHALESARYLMGIPRSTEVSASMFQNFKHLGQAPITTLRIALLFHPFSQRGGDATKTSWAGN
jgi:predicted dehydrogenase